MSIDFSLSKMAEFRVRGQSWERISQTSGVPSETLRNSARERRSEWKRELREAQKELRFEITAECLQALREKMIDDNPRIALDAAKTLLRFVQQNKKPTKEKEKGTTKPAGGPSSSLVPEPDSAVPAPAPVPPKPAPAPTPAPTTSGNPPPNTTKKGIFSFFSVLMVLLMCFVESANATSETQGLRQCSDCEAGILACDFRDVLCSDCGAGVLACNLRDSHHYVCQKAPGAAGTVALQRTGIGPERGRGRNPIHSRN